MDTMMAFMMGQANRGKEQMVFDWDKAAQIILEKKPERAYAGLQNDLACTGGAIYKDGKPVTDDYTYLASTWAKPILIIEIDDEETAIECYRMQHEVPKWNSGTKWPESSLKILEIQEEKMSKELWAIYHEYSEDGGYGDAIWTQELVGIVEATGDEVKEFIEKYNKPIVYAHPYDDLIAHVIRVEKINIVKDIRDLKPYGNNDFYGQYAKEYQLNKKYDQEYGEQWRFSEKRDEIYEKYFKDLEEIREGEAANDDG